ENLYAEVGVFYVKTEEGSLGAVAGYACETEELSMPVIKPGENLMGQVFLSKKPVILNDVPDDFLNINSALGKATPRSVIIFPLIYEAEVKGIIELGSFKHFSQKDEMLLERVSKPIAIALNTAFSRLELKELLEETQAQAEELQSQQEELQAINHELEQQTYKLTSSEEELIAQQEEILQVSHMLEERANELEEKNVEIIKKNNNLKSFSDEIAKKNKELQLSSKYKSEFLANMSHELRTPLNSILLLSKLMVDQGSAGNPFETKDNAQVIYNSGKNLLDLINEILDLSKIEAGKMELALQPVSIQELINETKALFCPLASHKKLKFEAELEDGLPLEIITDRLRLGQILKNLITNAIKFTDKGEVALKVQKALKIKPDGLPEDYIIFSVIDTGIGIPEDKQKLVFEAFHQIDGSSNRKYPGTGLGLSISQEICRLLGGSISLESQVGVGSTFTLTIPVQNFSLLQGIENPEETSKSEITFALNENISNFIPEPVVDDRKEISEGDKLILIVEDDVVIANELLSVARKKGYKGLVAVRGDEGLELAEKFKPSGIILDLRLPVVDGYYILGQLKENPKTAHIPVHIISSLDKNISVLGKGAVGFINKPLDIEMIEEVFSKIESAEEAAKSKVLVIDGNLQHAKAFSGYLKQLKIDSLCVESLEHGEEIINNEKMGCVVLDLKSLGKTPAQAFEAIKANSGFRKLPVILYTGRTLSNEDEKEISIHAADVVYKTAESYKNLLDEVSLFLHVVKDEKASGNKEPYLQEGVLKDKVILIADDDIRNVFSLTKVLEVHKVKVLTASDAKEALKVLEDNPGTSMVLMDLMMPEMDGFEAIKFIRENEKFKNLPIIAVTAKAMKGDREKCINAGASDYISKPVDADQLVSLMKVWLYQ
nr:response regulator [Bacteroidota bacterium]